MAFTGSRGERPQIFQEIWLGAEQLLRDWALQVLDLRSWLRSSQRRIRRAAIVAKRQSLSGELN